MSAARDGALPGSATLRYFRRVEEDGVTIRRTPRAGYRGLVAEVLLDDQLIGLVHLSGKTPPGELTELWTAAAVVGANVFLTEQEAIQRTISQARRHRWSS